MKTVAKAVQLLKMFTPDHDDWGVSELGRAAGINKVIVHRLLRSLAEGEFLAQDPNTRRYRLGAGLIELVRTNLRHVNVAEIAHPFLAALREETGETVLLSVRRGDSVVVVAAFEGRQLIRVTADVGDTASLHASASGKLFLAFETGNVLAQLRGKPLEKFTARSVTSLAALKKVVDTTRTRGWGLDDEEYVPGIRAIAAPIRARTGVIQACVAVRAPSDRMPRTAFPRIAARVITIANSVAAQMEKLAQN